MTADRGRQSFQLPLLQAASFTPTKWHSAEDKARFGNQLLAFIAADFLKAKWTNAFYGELCQHFGFIANYGQHGFWQEYFADLPSKLRFLRDLTQHPCYGDPAYTFSDLERVVIGRLRAAKLVERLREAVARDTEAIERALLRKLLAKYEADAPPLRPAAPVSSVTDWASDQPSLL